MSPFATIYLRPRDSYYVLAAGITTKGVPMACAPWIHFPVQTPISVVWQNVVLALEAFGKTVPHPENWKTVWPWFEKAGVKTWSRFAGVAAFCSVRRTEQGFTFCRGHWDGRGFDSSGDDKLHLPTNSTLEDLTGSLTMSLRSEDET